jgi:hypothetical protein
LVRARDFSFFQSVYTGSGGPTEPRIQYVPGVASGVKRPWPEADHSTLFSAEVNKERSCTFATSLPRVYWDFTFTRTGYEPTVIVCKLAVFESVLIFVSSR